MSGGYYNQHGYAAQPRDEPPQYLHQNYGYPGQGFAPASEEYLRQPPSAPYPAAPVYMPEPQLEPRVIIVQPPPPPRRDGECCELASCICRCVDWLLSRICYVLLGLVLLGVLLALGVWLINKYRHH